MRVFVTAGETDRLAVVGKSPKDAADHFGWLAHQVSIDGR
jgi:hypothetical protein